MKRTKHLGIALFIVTCTGLAAHAGVPQAVQQTFNGEIVITPAPLRAIAGSGSQIIDILEKTRVHELESLDAASDPLMWSFHFTAFLSRAPRTSELSLDFYTAGGSGRYVTSARLMGIDPAIRVLAGDVTVNEDDGLRPGTTYQVKLTGVVRGRELTFATTTVTLR